MIFLQFNHFELLQMGFCDFKFMIFVGFVPFELVRFVFLFFL